MSRTGARRRRDCPLGAQRRGVREREDVPGRDRNVVVVRKAGVACRDGDDIRERDARGNEGNGRRGAALPEAGALAAALGRRPRVGCGVLCGIQLWDGVIRVNRGRGCRRRVNPVCRAGVRELWSGRNDHEPEPDEQGERATPQRALHHTSKIGRLPTPVTSTPLTSTPVTPRDRWPNAVLEQRTSPHGAPSKPARADNVPLPRNGPSTSERVSLRQPWQPRRWTFPTGRAASRCSTPT